MPRELSTTRAGLLMVEFTLYLCNRLVARDELNYPEGTGVRKQTSIRTEFAVPA